MPMHSALLLYPPMASSSRSLMLQTDKLPRGEAIELSWIHLHMEVSHLPVPAHLPSHCVLQDVLFTRDLHVLY